MEHENMFSVFEENLEECFELDIRVSHTFDDKEATNLNSHANASITDVLPPTTFANC